MKKKGGKKKKAPKGFRKVKKKGKKAKKAVEDALEDGEDGEDGEDKAVNDVGDPLPTAAQLPRMVNEMQTQIRDVRTQVESLLADKPTMSSSAMDDEGDNGDLGI